MRAIDSPFDICSISERKTVQMQFLRCVTCLRFLCCFQHSPHTHYTEKRAVHEIVCLFLRAMYISNLLRLLQKNEKQCRVSKGMVILCVNFRTHHTLTTTKNKSRCCKTVRHSSDHTVLDTVREEIRENTKTMWYITRTQRTKGAIIIELAIIIFFCSIAVLGWQAARNINIFDSNDSIPYLRIPNSLNI